ncbi:MAG: hypothetical protein DMD67_01735 [Gemmatimonadetes bacterium]|nr:MAG: hypothetical protein DMD67_01735 [Gemmatimonadota bacterium]
MESVTVALRITDRPVVAPPTAIAVLPSLWNCPKPVGALGGTGIEVLTSGADSAFPPKAVQGPARPV